MNGRIYDPLLGRFLSADTVVQDTKDLQSYNRYSYCRNNPLSKVDPTGFEDADPDAAEVNRQIQHREHIVQVVGNGTDPSALGRLAGEEAKPFVSNTTIEVTQRFEGPSGVKANLQASVPIDTPSNSTVSGTISGNHAEGGATISRDGATLSSSLTGAKVTVGGSTSKDSNSAYVTVQTKGGTMTVTKEFAKEHHLEQQIGGAAGNARPAGAASAPSAMTSIANAVRNVVNSVTTSLTTSNIPVGGAVAVQPAGNNPSVTVTVGNTEVKAGTDLDKAHAQFLKDNPTSAAAEAAAKQAEDEKKKKENNQPSAGP